MYINIKPRSRQENMDRSFEDAWGRGMRSLFHAYDSTEKCMKQIDACFETLHDNSLSGKLYGLDWERREDIQEFLAASRPVLKGVLLRQYNCKETLAYRADHVRL